MYEKRFTDKEVYYQYGKSRKTKNKDPRDEVRWVGSYFGGPEIPGSPEIGYKAKPKDTKSNVPVVENRTPTVGKVPFIKFLNNPLLRMLFTPSSLAEPWLDEMTPWKARELTDKYIRETNPFLDQMAVRPQQEEIVPFELPTMPLVEPAFIRPKVPVVPWYDIPPTGPFISKSPKIGTITYRPAPYMVPAPAIIEIPPYHPMFQEPAPLEIPELLTEFELETKPQVDQSYDFPKPGRTNKISERVISIEVQLDAKLQPIVRFRNSRVKASTRRKRDVKANSKWIKMANLGISLTYGTYTEIMDFVEILVWDAYYKDPRSGKYRFAMHETDQNIVDTLKGIAEGKYSVDIGATLIDYTVSQAQDILIGQMSRLVTRELIDSGNWQSPQGPQGFVNKMQKDYKNVLSQYETENAKDWLPDLWTTQDLQERRLWNARTGLSEQQRP
jgi:hypothetical protein